MNDERTPQARPGQTAADRINMITPEMTILDIINRHRETERIFKRLEAELGVCVCCEALFLPLGEAADRFGFDLGSVMTEINAFIRPDRSKERTGRPVVTRSRDIHEGET